MKKETSVTNELTLLREIQRWLEGYRDTTDTVLKNVMIDEALDAVEDLLECIKLKQTDRRVEYETIGSCG